MEKISVIVPCYNEQNTIVLLLQAIYDQDWNQDFLEVIIADGMSGDNTRSVIAAFRQEHPDLMIKIIDNPARIIPAALNLAIEHASGEIIVRLDAHCIPERSYISRCHRSLKANLAENVGGIWEIKPSKEGWIPLSIAVAAAHPLGVGDARYRYTRTAGYVDTVPFGSYWKNLFDKIGRFDETLLTNEDYELNARLRKFGFRVWLDPEIRSTYFSRPNLTQLGKQYWRYGFWKWRMLKRYPDTIRWRQALPPLFILLLGLLLMASFFVPVAFKIFLTVVTVYTGTLIASSMKKAIFHRDPRLLAGVPLAIMTMHFCWGSGFTWSVVSSFVGKN